MTDLDCIIGQCVEDLWGKFDQDNSGELDYIETKKLVVFILGGSAKSFSETEFKMIFNEFDTNGDQHISRSEMLYFLKKILNLDY